MTTPPPHNIEAEQAFLGALLYENGLHDRVADWLSPAHFYDPVHARIYQAAAERIARGQLADAIVLKTEFERDGGLAEIGGSQYLAILLENAADFSAAIEYARIIEDLGLRRTLINIGEGMVAAATEEHRETRARDIMESVEADLLVAAERGGRAREAVPFSTALAQSIDMASAAYEREGALAGLSCGLKSIDAKLGGLQRTDLIIVAGRPGMGKTAFATNIAFWLAKNWTWETDPDGRRQTVRGASVGFFSLEMSAEQLSTRIIADYCHVPSNDIRRGAITAIDYVTLRDGVQEIAKIPIYIDDTGGITVESLCARARRMKRRYGINLLVVDYLQLLRTARAGREANRVQEIAEITGALKALAKELNIPVIALSQLSRKVEQREDKKPQLSDLRDSGAIEQDADVVMFLYREEYYLEKEEPRPGTQEHLAWDDQMRAAAGLAEVIIDKQRHGPTGTVKVAFDKKFTRFTDLEERR